MSLFTHDQISVLERYHVAVTQIAHDFYDARCQLRDDVKNQMRDDYPFYDVREGLDVCSASIAGDMDVLAENIRTIGYTALAPYREGSTGMTCLVANDQNDWALVRGWQIGQTYNHPPDTCHFNLLPDIVLLSKEEEWSDSKPLVWTVPLMPVSNLTETHNNDLRNAYPIFSEFLSNSEIYFIDLEDLGFYPDGRFSFVDPGHAGRTEIYSYKNEESVKALEATRVETINQYMDALSNRPHLATLFDYRNNPQQIYFPCTS